jgi:hypothetical protein
MTALEDSKHFYLCNNPGYDVPDGVLTFIYSAVQPRFFASLSRLDGSVPFTDLAYVGISFMFYYRAADDQKVYAYLLRIADNIDNVGHHELLDILKAVAKWYADSRAIELGAEEVEIGWLKPFSEHLNGFQILEHPDNGTCLLNFALGCQGFKDTDGALKFLEERLGIDKKLISTGGLAINR